MKQVHILNKNTSMVNQYLAELRDVEVQKNSLRFKRNLQRMGWYTGFEISKHFNYQKSDISTPLGTALENTLVSDIVIISVLRAALPFSEGISEVFDGAETGFIGAMRTEGTAFDIDLSYIAIPDISHKNVIIADPMLATGKSLVKTVGALLAKGQPTSLDIATVISAPEGIDYLKAQVDMPFRLWTGAVDDHLNEKAYIVPGLGDAGDLSFGPKI